MKRKKIWQCRIPIVEDCNCITVNGVVIIWHANRFGESIAKLYAISSSCGELLWDLEIEGHIIQDVKLRRRVTTFTSYYTRRLQCFIRA